MWSQDSVAPWSCKMNPASSLLKTAMETTGGDCVQIPWDSTLMADALVMDFYPPKLLPHYRAKAVRIKAKPGELFSHCHFQRLANPDHPGPWFLAPLFSWTELSYSWFSSVSSASSSAVVLRNTMDSYNESRHIRIVPCFPFFPLLFPCLLEINVGLKFVF